MPSTVACHQFFCSAKTAYFYLIVRSDVLYVTILMDMYVPFDIDWNTFCQFYHVVDSDKYLQNRTYVYAQIERLILRNINRDIIFFIVFIHMF